MCKKKAKKKVKKKAKAKAKKKAGKKMGPPVKYHASFANQAKLACQRGASDTDLAKLFGVTRQTIREWRLKYEKFEQAIKEGREAFATGEVEVNFRRQALPHDEIVEIHELKGRGKNRKMTLTGKRIKKDVVNTHAGERVLKAEKPDKYGDKMDLRHGGAITAVINVKKNYGNRSRGKQGRS